MARIRFRFYASDKKEEKISLLAAENRQNFHVNRAILISGKPIGKKGACTVQTEQTVYVDLFFLINFSMDFLCLFLTAKLLNRKFSVGRALGGAALGGLYADVALFWTTSASVSLLLDGAACVGICATVFYQKKKGKSLPLYILVFAAISMALGGIMTALFHLFNRSGLFSGLNGGSGDGISVWIFALLAAVSGGITWIGGRFFAGRTAQQNADVEITYEGKTVRLHAMTDNGNLLREPISGRPCIVADVKALSPILPTELAEAARRRNPQELERLPLRCVKQIRLIPTHTASGEGLLFGLRPDCVRVEGKTGIREVDALIALADLGHSAGGNEALLPSALLVS